MDLELAGKVALVAGGGSDVGRATALGLAREGAEVILVGRRPEPLEETAARVRSAGGRAHVLSADLADGSVVARVVGEARGLRGRIDLLANTVGPFPTRALAPGGAGPLYGSDESWTEAFDGVFMTAARLSREVLPLMKEQGAGAVVHLGSNSARYYNPMTAQFAAMKAALVHAVKNWARDASPHGVRVNAILPGWIGTDGTLGRIREAAEKEGRALHEVEGEMVRGHDNLYWTPRVGGVEEYADAILFLLSQRASYINGALVPVDGGSPVW